MEEVVKMRKTLEQKASEFQPVRKALKKHERIDRVRVNVGMPMEYDPNKGEVPIPDGVDFFVGRKTFSLVKHVSDVCDQFGLEVKMPEYRQHENQVFIRLVPE